MLEDIDQENNDGFETFIDALNERFDILFDADIDEILDFLTEEMGLESDADITNMSESEINQLKKFINQVLEELNEGD